MEHVIFVHGTFAGSKEDAGLKWWQKGSGFAKSLESRLPSGVSSTAIKNSFHWSGNNSYSARRCAAEDLLKYVSSLESNKESYHIVAHSHGGGVVWDALVLSDMSLKSLKSVTTIGTPFLTWQVGKIGKIIQYVDLLYFLILILTFPVLWVLLADNYMSLTIILPFTILIGIVFSLLSMPVIFAYSAKLLRKERYSGMKAALYYGSRCMFLYSEDDEAILSLQAALASNSAITSKSQPRMYSSSDNKVLRKIVYAGSAPARWIYKKILASYIDRLIWSALRNNAYGADLDGATVCSVDTEPFEYFCSANPLPVKTTTDLTNISQEGINRALPDIRKALGQYSAGNLKAKEDALSLDNTEVSMLIHTSYFECSDIVELIAAHIYQQSQLSAGVQVLSEYLDDFFKVLSSKRLNAIKEMKQSIEIKLKEKKHEDIARVFIYGVTFIVCMGLMAALGTYVNSV